MKNVLTQDEIDNSYFVDLIAGIIQQDSAAELTEMLQYRYPKSYSRLCEIIVKQICRQYKVKLVPDKQRRGGDYEET